MSKINYRSYDIELREVPETLYVSGPITRDVKYTVSNPGGMVFAAESAFGVSYATTGEAALNGAKTQVDRAVDSVEKY